MPAVAHYPALVIGRDLRVDGLWTDEQPNYVIRIREKSGLAVATLRDVETRDTSRAGLPIVLVRSSDVVYGSGWIDAFGPPDDVYLSIEHGSDCGCSGPKRTRPTEADLALLHDWLPV